MKYVTVLVALIAFCSCIQKEKPVSDLVQLTTGDVAVKVLIVGRLRSERSILVRSPIEAQLVRLYKTLGSRVEVGDVLVTIAQPPDETKTVGMIQVEGKLHQVQLQKAQAQIKIDSAKRELDSSSRLLAAGSIAASEHEKVKLAYDLVKREIDNLNVEEKMTLQSISVKKQSNKSMARTLIAPKPGIVTQLWTSEDNITPGMTIAKDTIVVIIEEPGQYVLKGEVIESDYLRLQLGQQINISLSHGDSTTWKGAIKSISPIAKQDQFGIGRFEVTAIFSGDQSKLRTGLEARGEVVLKERKSVLRVPRSAVKAFDGRHFISLPSKDGPVRRELKIGLVGDQHVEVIEGIQPNTSVYQAYVEAHP